CPGLRIELRPEGVYGQVTGQPVPGLQAQQLQKVRGAQAAPATSRNPDTVNRDRESAEELDLERNGCTRQGADHGLHASQCAFLPWRAQAPAASGTIQEHRVATLAMRGSITACEDKKGAPHEHTSTDLSLDWKHTRHPGPAGAA